MRVPILISIVCLSLLQVCVAQAQTSLKQVKILCPDEVILGDRANIRITGLSPKATVTLNAEMIDRNGRLWRSTANFMATAAGEIHLEKQAPQSGSYSGIDGLGLYWSMQDTKAVQTDSPIKETFERSIVVFRVIQDGKTLAEKQQTRWRQKSGVTSEDVKAHGFLATFYKPQGKSPRAGIILVGGSSGGIGWQRQVASMLASHGYCALALAYFNIEGLSPNLEKIPLEYFEKAINWMSANPAVDKKRLAVIGVSKGGELALLLGSHFPQLKAIIGYVPSSVVFQSIIFQKQTTPDPMTSSWTLNGEDVPFVPYAASEKYQKSRRLVDLYDATLENRAAAEKAVIKVEKIEGAVLLISGGDDAVWPSKRMSEEVMARLKQHNHRFASKHLAYPEAGHSISLPGYYPSADTVRNGGTAKANAHAMAEGWQELLNFLSKNLR
jgi:dienelactone hydrolase